MTSPPPPEQPVIALIETWLKQADDLYNEAASVAECGRDALADKLRLEADLCVNHSHALEALLVVRHPQEPETKEDTRMDSQCDATDARPASAAFPSAYRKKPVVIQALQFTGTAAEPSAFCGQNSGVRWCHSPRPHLEIPTMEGTMTAEVGDWIIRGVKGELYPCKPDIFALTYEPVAEAPVSPVLPRSEKEHEKDLARAESADVKR